ncbi:MAG TPA: transposase [Kofleriaceae bacterium]
MKSADKNGQFRGARKGDKRKSGRKKRGYRASERHGVRAELTGRDPIHVVVRVDPDVQPLRRKGLWGAIRRATYVVARLEQDMRIIELSVQDTHIHLLVEATNKIALAKGMQSFGVSVARQINTALEKAGYKIRRGAVIADRYHARVLKTPREVRNCLAYVMNNWRKHGADQGHSWNVDPYSSAPSFTGWKELPGRRVKVPSKYRPLVTQEPRTWLLRVGWKKHGLISMLEVPKHDSE